VPEAGAALVRFSDQADPGGVDTAAGFRYSYALSQGALATSYADATDGASKPFTFPDDGSYTVYGRIFDKDGGYTEYQTTIIVADVAPTATRRSAGPVPEAGAVAVRFTDPADVSGVDTAAGFRYSYALSPADLAATYAAATDGASKQFSFADDGSYT